MPETLIEQWHGAERPSPVWYEWLDGALMHCDITGFTSMSESLQSLGREGAELMAGVLNRFFETMLGVADRWQGVQMKFGGDAMLLYFDAADGAARAAACGLEMQRNMPQFRRVEVAGQAYVLRMRIGIHAGRFFSASTGNGDGVLQYLLLGHDVNETAAVEAAAQPGEVVATEAAASAMASAARTMPTDSGVWRVQSTNVAAPMARDKRVLTGDSVLRRYVLPAVADALEDGVGLPSEQRRVTSMFVTLLGTTELLARSGEDETLRQVNAYANILATAVTRHGGVLLGNDVADHGDKFIVLFGAPTLTEEHEANAIRCAIELSAALAGSGLDLRQQGGVHTGPVFAGEIGSPARREYTVIGDTVNLAARLMAAARPGETLVSESTAQRLGGAFTLRRRKAIRVKGKSAPVRLFALAGTSGASTEARTPQGLPFVGRAAEVDALLAAAERTRGGEPAWCAISGTAGIGKTRLAAEAAQRLAGWSVLHATARSHTSGTPFGAWLAPLRRLASVEEGAEREQAAAALRAEIARAVPAQAQFAGVLADLLGLPVGADELFTSLDAKARRDRLTSLVVAVVEAKAHETPLLLLFEDAQWSDAASIELLAEVLQRVRAPFAVYVTTREPALPEPLAARPPEQHIRLEGLRPAEARELIAPLVSDDASAGAIVARAQGNPLFMIEMAQAPAGSSMPETVHDVVLARLDALRRSDREMLRLASVVGPSFALASVLALETSVTESYVAGACNRLLAAGFLQRDDSRYAFAHTLTSEVAYETLLYADRRRLHRTLAQHIEQREDAGAMAETLLHHFGAARDWGRVARYGMVSGDRASAIFATEEAANHYQAALEGLDEIGPQARIDRSIVLERLGDALDSAGRHREAGDAYFTSLGEWLTRGTARRARYVHADLRTKAREALICRKISVSYERRSDYEQALSWIDQALERLPSGPASVAAEVMASKSVTLFRRGQYAEATDWGKRAVTLARRSRDRRIMAYAHNMLANSYIEQGALKEAVRHLTSSTRLYHELRDLRGQSAAGNNLASCYQLLGNMDQALYYYQDALHADARLGNVTHAAIIHNNIGEVLLALGRVQEAEEHLRDVLTTHAANPGLAALAGLSEVNLSRGALIRGDAGAADLHVMRGIRLLRQVGAAGMLDEAELQLVEVRLAQSRWRDALKRGTDVVERSRASGAKLMEARGERLIGVAQRGLGNAEAATTHLRESAALARKIGASIEEASALVELASLFVDTGRVKQTGRIIDRAERIARRIGDARQIERLRNLRERAAAPK